MDHQTKIKNIQQKIQEYQTQYPQRNWEQKHKLSTLYLELVYWQLVEEGEIKPDPLFFKVKEFWGNLKKTYQTKGKWPYAELEAFLTQQVPKYKEYLISFIQQETKPEYLKLVQWLSKLTSKNVSKIH